MSDHRHLIMGFFTGNSFRPLERFIASLRQVGFAGDVCLLVTSLAGETIATLRSHGIIVERLGRSGQPRMTAMASRYFSYLDFLARHVETYARVMLLDPRTALLQSDPFAVPLPADIVYTRERCLLGDSPEDTEAVTAAYGEQVAWNVRDWPVSCPDITIGSAHGVLEYLVAMTHELSGRTTPIGGDIHRGIHNYVVHMRPLRRAWLDDRDQVAVALRSVPDAAIAIGEHGVVVEGRLPPVLNQWEDSVPVRAHIVAAPRVPLQPAGAPPARPAAAPVAPPLPRRGADAVIAYYHRPRDADWLAPFLSSLRSAGHTGPVHCIGEFDATERELLDQHRCNTHPAPANEPDLVENLAHLAFSQMIERLADESPVPLDQVLVLDRLRVVFVRDPFETKTIGLSAFCEGGTRIGDSEYNAQRLALFPPMDETWLRRPIVSSSLLRGPLTVMQAFYRRLLPELVGRAEHLRIQKVIQGAVNKLCHGGTLGFPITLHPNGAEAYQDITPSGLALDTRLGVRIGGAVPAMVMNPFGLSPIVTAVLAGLGLELPGTPDA